MDNQRKEGEGNLNPQNRNRASDTQRRKPFGDRNNQPRGEFKPRDDKFQPRNDFRDRKTFDNRQGTFADRRDTRAAGDTRERGGFRDRNDPRSGQPYRGGGGGFRDRKPFNERTPGGGIRGGGPRGRSGGFQSRKFGGKPSPKPWEIRTPKIVSDLQITDGKHKGKYFENSKSPKIGLTPRALREIMFKIIYRRIRFSRFLDLCAGSGAIGLEALSRGSLVTTFIDRSAKMAAMIKKNIAGLGIKPGHGEVFEIEAMPFLKRMAKKKRFWDVIYFNPYAGENYDEVLELLGRGSIIEIRGCLVIEHNPEITFPEQIGCLRRFKVIEDGGIGLTFFERI